MADRRDVLLDDDGNRVLVGQDYGFASGLQAVKQGVQCNVRLFRAEYWLNQAIGVDYLGKILIRSPNSAVVKSEFAAAIASTPDVTRVVNTAYSVNGANRSGSIAYNAASPFGLISSEVQT